MRSAAVFGALLLLDCDRQELLAVTCQLYTSTVTVMAMQFSILVHL
jgi:hypothetical protein